MDPLLLQSISLRNLNRNPGLVMEKVESGERFIVTRHGRPVATLQPIDGYIVDPLRGTETDICGVSLGSPRREAEKLSQVEKEMLVGAGRLNHRVTYGNTSGDGREESRSMRSLTLRGLLHRSRDRGLILTGRGMVLKEWLQKQGLMSEADRARLKREAGKHSTGS